jgi:CMP-N-acetylneuraminic acid synthetase
MYKNKTLLAIIPARSNSKRLPRKNILDLEGKPLIAWTIESALKSKYIDRVIVSTNDDEIAYISKKYGADVPFMRPEKLASDEAKSVDVVLELLDRLKEDNEFYDYIVLLQPTSPLRSNQDINTSVELLKDKKCEAVISVCKSEHSPLWSNTLPDNNSMINFLDKKILNKNSQDLNQFYRLNGAIYLCNTTRLKKEKTFFLNSKCFAYKMTFENSIDIDNIHDLNLAKVYINA